jgi:lipopolysaccharide transport system ATP-binding protein
VSDIVIKAENLGKKYIISHKNNGSYTAMRDILTQNARDLWRKTKDFVRNNSLAENKTEQLWALEDINFEIKQGETVGIIGRNGAGKSTLLKVLSRITEPTTGRVYIKGRVSSLLEVGTGFHPELTGRENIYLNGAILGMTRTEIKRKFDEIAAFAETEKFLDTPVKRYSSGMYVRLAFSVAAHLEPEILLVDEVLAVGDFAFQKKCLGKMENEAKKGRTVIFVSHNMDAISRLCSSSYWLDAGRIVESGRPEKVIRHYLCSNSHGQTQWKCLSENMDKNKAVQIVGVRLQSADGLNSSTVKFGPPLTLEIESIVREEVRGATFNLTLKNTMGTIVFISAEQDCNMELPLVRKEGRHITICHLPGDIWMPGHYSITVGIQQEYTRVLDRVEDIIHFEVAPINSPGADGRRGIVSPILQWETLKVR